MWSKVVRKALMMPPPSSMTGPLVVRAGILIAAIGVVFPIYGTPVGLFGLPRITLFRFGLGILVTSGSVYRLSILSVIRRK